MEAQLRRLGPSATVKTLRVPNECRTKIWLAGRGTSCQIYTKSIYASRQHFSITYRDQKYFISDLQSANGTFVNGEKLASEKVLTFGSVISVGVPSEMQNSPECIVYIFESNSDALLPCLQKNDENCGILQLKSSYDKEATEKLKFNANDVQPNQTKTEFFHKSMDIVMKGDEIEDIALSESSSSDVILIEPPTRTEHFSPESPLNEHKPAKIRKLDDCLASHIKDKEEEKPPDFDKKEKIQKNIHLDDEDILAYEALTQMDEQPIKSEPDLLNYSQTEELIEISDSEDDWSPGLKMEGNKPEEIDGEEDDDDDIIILEAVSHQNSKNELLSSDCKVEDDDMTEADKKWMGRLLKIKTEVFRESQEPREIEIGDLQKEVTEPAPTAVDEPEGVEDQEENTSSKADKLNVTPCTVKLSMLSTNDIPRDKVLEPAVDSFPRGEVSRKVIQRDVPKKSVSFDMVPQIKYFEVATRSKLTASEKGRLRFNRVIFNICNWNTHWLEECKRVAPDKIPSDICEERLRKIPKKFPCHSDYMVAFIPAMLLHLWNKIKDKWVSSGESGFRQTVSCDSCEDYHAENLLVYNCTGLVQSVNAHKHLIREGHLVLLRLHQIQVPQFTTPATEKYSKKLGYLVFGFVERKIYERYHNQPLHPSLAERCASIVGDLHIVRLAILVKKRPSFKIDKQKLIQLTVLQQISQEIRMFRGICLLPDSPLCEAILKPTKREVLLPESLKKDLVFKGPLDDIQSEIVTKLSDACFYTSSLLYSIHGASGTGKSQVIVALILQLLYGTEWKGKRPKIIYCTQWSIPLDETVTKLKALRQSLEEPFKLVRAGPVREVKPDLRDLCVSHLASSLRNSDARALRNFDAEAEILKEADIICSTCTSAGAVKMCAAFEKLLMKDRNRKIICIIDEAMSCKETDSVIPLLLGVTHLILVGDIYQMEPTFSGEKTHSLGLDMSLFWRIYKNFINVPKELWLISVLKTQYRMNPSLSKFTSQLIYNMVLQKPSQSVSKRIANIRTHLLLIDQTPENVTKQEKENREVRIVSQLTKALIKLTKTAVSNAGRFGVIIRDMKQIEILQSLLPKKEFPEVEIDQIQAFQGKEFDVIIFVCDGRKIVTSWLATALTRARRSLFIFASEQSINGNPLLGKVASSAKKYNFWKYVHPDMTLLEFEQTIV